MYPASCRRSGVTALGFTPGLSQPRGGCPSKRVIASVTSRMSVASPASSKSFWCSELVRPCPSTSSPRLRNAVTTSGQW